MRIETSNEWAVLSGNSGHPNKVLLTYITSDFSPEKAVVTQLEVPLVKNAQVYTSGAGGIFPRGIPVGLVSGTGRRKNDFKTAFVEPFVQINRLDYVSVIIKKPEVWSKALDQKLRWQEHLKTEFGNLVYPKLPPNKKKRTVKKIKPRSVKTVSQSKKEEAGKQKKTEKNTTPKRARRLQNVSPYNER